MKTSHLSQAQDKILGKAHALWDPNMLWQNRLWQNHHEEPPTLSGLGFHSLFERLPCYDTHALGKTNAARYTMKKPRQRH